jgi:hypothetical protein
MKLDIIDISAETTKDGVIKLSEGAGIDGTPYEETPSFSALGITAKARAGDRNLGAAEAVCLYEHEPIIIAYRDNRIKITAEEGEVVVHDVGNDTPKSVIRISPDGSITITSGSVTVNADGEVEINAGGNIQVNADLVKLDASEIHLNGSADNVVTANRLAEFYNDFALTFANHTHEVVESLAKIPQTFKSLTITPDQISSETVKTD